MRNAAVVMPIGRVGQEAVNDALEKALQIAVFGADPPAASDRPLSAVAFRLLSMTARRNESYADVNALCVG